VEHASPSSPERPSPLVSPPILLASGSPRRREILASLGVPFVVKVAAADESTLPGEAAASYLERVVRAKLAAIDALLVASPELSAPPSPAPASPRWVLVADTSVILEGRILGKPASIDEAASMIAELEGRTHEVWTRFAVAALGAATGGKRRVHEETVATRVTFRSLTPARVRAYAESGEGMDKAGAYAVQGRGAGLVARIEGSYSNVVGLPACEVALALEELGILP